MSKKRSRASSFASNDASTTSSAHASSSRSVTIAPGAPLVHPTQDLEDFQESFWRHQMDLVEQGGDNDGSFFDFKTGLPTQGQLPLARIKKVMKSDDQVKMISAEAPILFARACEIFISDLTCRAFLIAEEHKRRTIQRSDIAGAIGRSDLFDFLIDIVPRHESIPSSRLPGGGVAKMEKSSDGQNANRARAAKQRATSTRASHIHLQHPSPQQHQPQSQSPSQSKPQSQLQPQPQPHPHPHSLPQLHHLQTQTQQHHHPQTSQPHTPTTLYDPQPSTAENTSPYVDLEPASSHHGSLGIPHTSSSTAGHDMSPWLHDNTEDHTSQPDSNHHLDYTASAVAHSWQNAFPEFN